jgi:hypothetical protein
VTAWSDRDERADLDAEGAVVFDEIHRLEEPSGVLKIAADEHGGLWEHLVLDELRARVDQGAIAYWRDKSGRELDFSVKRPKRAVDVLECKVDPGRFDPEVLKVFRSQYPDGRNIITGPWVEAPYRRRYGDLTVTCGTPADLLDMDRPKPRGRGPS